MSHPTFRPRRASSWWSLLVFLAFEAGPSQAGQWVVNVQIHDVLALTNSDAWDEQDMYRKV